MNNYPSRFMYLSGIRPLLLTVLFLVGLCLCGVETAAQEREPADISAENLADDSSAFVPLLQYVEVTDRRLWSHFNLTGAPKLLGKLHRNGTMGANYCTERVLKSAQFSVLLNLGEDYVFGKNAFSVQVQLKVYGKDAGGTTLITHDPIDFNIDQAHPEQLFRVKYSGADLAAYENVDYFDVHVVSYSPATLVQDSILVTARYREEYAVGAVDTSAVADPLVAPEPKVGTVRGNPVEFEWTLNSPCSDSILNYQFQLLRLYNINPTYDEETEVEGVIDWDQALTIETGNGTRKLNLTPAEGTGYYVWRVRPIGSIYNGGIADSRNWGVWSCAPDNDDVVTVTDPAFTRATCADSAVFFYQQFDADINYAYGRLFSEGSEGTRISEGVTYATPALRPVQTQGRIQSQDSILVGTDGYDFVGRPVISALPAPEQSGVLAGTGETAYFGYIENLLQNDGTLFTEEQYDADSTYLDPNPVDEGLINDYWSDANTDDISVPSAEDYPYGRTLFYSDGSGRPRESGGIGKTHRIGGGAGGKDRTVKYYYSGVSDRELVRLFGDEAPVDSSVVKVLVTGPNKVTSVRYVSMEGSTIAVGLVRPQGDTLLTTLNESGIMEAISDTLTGDRYNDTYGFSSRKRIAFAESTEVKLSYRILPNTFTAGACDTVCSTCDYHVSILFHNVNDPDSTLQWDFVIPPGECTPEGPTQRDTVIVITVPPGSYMVERRLTANTTDPATITAENPLGETYAATFREQVAAEMRADIYADDSLSTVIQFLNEKKLDSLYLYLGLDLDSLEGIDYVTIETGCCSVEIPILDPDCGFDPCRDSVPDFEAHLIETWHSEFAPGDSANLNKYFWEDGGDKYADAPGGFPNGKGAFNFMIAEMLQEVDADSNYIYDCKTLWSIWDGLVRSFRDLATKGGNPADKVRTFDLLETFVGYAGRILQDTSTVPWSTSRGYLLFPYKYVNYSIGDDTDCEAAAGYNAGWHGDADSSTKWERLRVCVRGKTQQNTDLSDELNTCLEAARDEKWDKYNQCVIDQVAEMEGACRNECASRFHEFRDAVIDAFGYSLSADSIDCVAWTMVDSCRALCNLTIFHSQPLDEAPIDSIGTPEENERIGLVWTHDPVVSLPVIDGTDTTCANDSLTFYSGWKQPLQFLIVEYLNRALDSVRLTAPVDGFLWNFKPVLARIAPPSLVSGLVDSLVYVPGVDTVDVRFELRDTCDLWYTGDTLFVGSPEDPHPMVHLLNNYLDAFWNYEVNLEGIGYPSKTSYYGMYWAPTANDSIEYVESLQYYLQSKFSGINGSVVSKALYETGIEIRPISAEGTSAEYPVFKRNGEAKWKLRLIEVIASLGIVSDYTAHQVTFSMVGDTILPLDYSDNLICNHTYMSWPRLSNDSVLEIIFDGNYTERIGWFGQDLNGYLNYYSYDTLDQNDTVTYSFDTMHVRTWCTVRFYKYFAKPLHLNFCDTIGCPAVCFGWTPKDTAYTPQYVDSLLPEPCNETALRRIRDAVEQDVNECIAAKTAELVRTYRDSCASPETLEDELIIGYDLDYYHFTLFYYDRSGALVKTVPPMGVDYSSDSRADHPAHRLVTEYDYNSVGQLLRTRTPDADTSFFLYDYYGRLRFSRDQKQRANGTYSYVKYDYLSRPVEVGESSDSIAGEAFLQRHNLEDPDFPPAGTERTYMVYTEPSGMVYPDGVPQKNLRNRISYTYNDDSVFTHYSYDIHGNVVWIAQEIPGFPWPNYVKYDYDLVSGNVNEVAYNEGRVDQFYHRYVYDQDHALREVYTSRDRELWDRDAAYTYYKHGPLKRVEIGEDRLQGLDLTYTVQGQLKGINHPALDTLTDRGEDGTYGSRFAADSFAVSLSYFAGDYRRSGAPYDSGAATNLEGTPLYDGNVSTTASVVGLTTNPATAKYEQLTGYRYRYDQLGRLDSANFVPYDVGNDQWDTAYTLGEYSTSYDYDPNGNLVLLERSGYHDGTWGKADMDSLIYHYVDTTQNNRLDYVHDGVAGDPYPGDITQGQSATNYEYDETGNLVEDFSEGGMSMDYTLYGKVKEVDRVAGGFAQGIDYTYDAAGNRVKKTVTTSYFPGSTTVTTYYVRDAAGIVVAIYEEECEEAGFTQPDTDFDTVPDAFDNCPGAFNPDQADKDGDGLGDACDPDIDGDGVPNGTDTCPWDFLNICPPNDKDSDGIPSGTDNCPSVHNPTQTDTDGDGIGDACDSDLDNDGTANDHDICPWDSADRCNCELRLVELPIYGLDRIGMVKPDIDIYTDLPPDTLYTRTLDEKRYELTDHLGNVRAVLGDVKLSDPATGGGVENFHADITSYTHPYPFGSPQPGRTYQAGEYRYGFNGMESDPEVAGGDWNHFTTYFRQYDSRLGRWWSTDPVTFPSQSPYGAMNNNPLYFSDASGATGDPQTKNTNQPEKEEKQAETSSPAEPQPLYEESTTFNGSLYRGVNNQMLVLPINADVSNEGDASALVHRSDGTSFTVALDINDDPNVVTNFSVTLPDGTVETYEARYRWIRQCTACVEDDFMDSRNWRFAGYYRRGSTVEYKPTKFFTVGEVNVIAYLGTQSILEGLKKPAVENPAQTVREGSSARVSIHLDKVKKQLYSDPVRSSVREGTWKTSKARDPLMPVDSESLNEALKNRSARNRTRILAEHASLLEEANLIDRKISLTKGAARWLDGVSIGIELVDLLDRKQSGVDYALDVADVVAGVVAIWFPIVGWGWFLFRLGGDIVNYLAQDDTSIAWRRYYLNNGGASRIITPADNTSRSSFP